MNLTLIERLMKLAAFSSAGEGAAGGGDGGVAPPASAEGGDGAGADASGEAKDAPVSTALGDAFKQVQSEEKPGEGEDKDGEKKEGEEEQKDGDDPAPFELEVPKGMEGFSGEFTAYSTAATDFLKANPGASAQDALKWAAEYQSSQVRDAGAAMRAQFEQTVQGWESEVKADPELGGAKYDATIKDAVRGLSTFGSPKLVELLNDSGLGSHREVIAAFAKVGKLAQESPILGGEGGKGNVSFAEALYGKKG